MSRTETNLRTGKITEHADAPLPVLSSEEQETLRTSELKKEAGIRILTLDPSWTAANHAEKQRNDLMLGMGALLNAIKAVNAGVSTDTDDALLAADDAMVKAHKVGAIRDLANTAKNNGDSVKKFRIDLDAAGF